MLKYLMLVALLPACTSGRLSGDNCTTVKRGNFPILATPDSILWSIVDFREIDNHCNRESFVYSGTFKDYHLLFWDDNNSKYVASEHRFAVLRGTYTPQKPFDYSGSRNISGNGGQQNVFR